MRLHTTVVQKRIGLMAVLVEPESARRRLFGYTVSVPCGEWHRGYLVSLMQLLGFVRIECRADR
jgi:hypothetical protein